MHKMTQRRRLILELLATDGPLTRAEVAEKFETSLKSRWSSLIAAGWIESVGTRRDFAHGDESELLAVTAAGRIALARPAVKPSRKVRKSQAEQEAVLDRIFDAGIYYFGVKPGAYFCLSRGQVAERAERNVLLYLAVRAGVSHENAAARVGLTFQAISGVRKQVRTAIDESDARTIEAIAVLTKALDNEYL